MASKRQSEQRVFYPKRVKQEKIFDSDNKVDDEIYKQLYGSDDDSDFRCETSDINHTLSSLELPTNIDQLMLYILKLKLTTIPKEIEKLKSMFVNSLNNFRDLNEFKVTFLPPLLYQLLNDISLSLNQFSNFEKFSVYIKIKTQTETRMEFRCISMRNLWDPCVFKVGDLILVKAAFKGNSDLESDIITSDKEYLGYIIYQTTRKVNLKNPSETNHFGHFSINERIKLVVDEIIFQIESNEEIRVRNDFYLLVRQIMGIRGYILKAKSLFNIEICPLSDQILKPEMQISASGLNISTDLLLMKESDQLDAIQKAFDLVVQGSSKSKVLCIDCPNKSTSEDIQIDIVKQLILGEHINITKSADKQVILLVSPNEDILSRMYDKLSGSVGPENRIVIMSGPRKDQMLDTLCIQHFDKKLRAICCQSASSNCIETDIELIKDCKNYIVGQLAITQLSVDAYCEMISSKKLVWENLFSVASLILSTMDSIFSNIEFYHSFCVQLKKNRIVCCIVDEATSFSEPEVICLSSLGIEKFILLGNSSDALTKNDRLNRSMFSRFYSLGSEIMPDSYISKIN